MRGDSNEGDPEGIMVVRNPCDGECPSKANRKILMNKFNLAQKF